jgi:hypothetical protein
MQRTRACRCRTRKVEEEEKKRRKARREGAWSGTMLAQAQKANLSTQKSLRASTRKRTSTTLQVAAVVVALSVAFVDPMFIFPAQINKTLH